MLRCLPLHPYPKWVSQLHHIRMGIYRRIPTARMQIQRFHQPQIPYMERVSIQQTVKESERSWKDLLSKRWYHSWKNNWSAKTRYCLAEKVLEKALRT